MKKRKIHVSKLDAARRQIETAITLYFANGDFVSIHTLAYAAFNITRSLCDKYGDSESFTQWVEKNLPKSFHKMAWQGTTEASNFFKHADRDGLSTLEYVPDQYEFFMIYAAKQYERITHEKPIPMRVFEMWFLIHHPNWLRANPTREALDGIKEAFPADRAKFYDEASEAWRQHERQRIESAPRG